ncbi:uncharacterized protein N7469_002842 [Penicillium citrinum]|uniref:Uncharacterized protein n=2 Tax=Penicillium TaxID=5073 RepID=A0A9W9TTW8_PENCI|nr:uncharacterized protein N7469_002842 [Penicillium citrinum]KAJ5241251.1 hypothetical protein N7469_002842 [Penicillium citrinum]KAJ5586251.1 hypothetical protein N7450_006038 [Penicillium hetheringtonii]
MSGEDKSLLERVEMPTIPKDAQKQIAILEEQFDRAQVEQLRKSVPVLQSLFDKRNEIINIPDVKSDFWIRVFASAPPEIEEYLLPADEAVLGTCLKNLKVERFEVDAQGNGEPRSLRFTFDFETGEENPFFENSQLVKEFYWRKQIIHTSKGKRRTWEGLVSDPVRINWKKDMDLTKGLLDATCNLFDAEKKGGKRTDLPEYEALVKKIAEVEDEEEDEEMNDDDEDEEDPHSPTGTSFFAFFGYRGRDVSAEVSKAAVKEDDERFAKILKGEKVEGEDDEDDEDDEDEEAELADAVENAEIFPNGEELAMTLADDLWTDAMKYYISSFEPSNEFDLEDLDLEELDGMDEEEDSGEGEESRPAKKARN